MTSSWLRAGALALGLTVFNAHAHPPEDSVPQTSPSPRPAFDNPGGMWMPPQIPAQAELLRKLGLELDPAELADPSSNLLQSIVSLGGCSGSFVSAQGLIITNHHCVQSILSYLSQEARGRGENADFVKSGYVARTRAEELPAGPAREIFITTKFIEVTDEVTSGVDAVADPVARTKLVEARVKEIVRQSEARDENVRAEVASYFRQEKYFLIEKLRIRDLRMVYAPPEAVGFFGGDEHNWHWPRFVGDFALLRPYVTKDGRPAPYSPDNVPYQPKRHFRISRRGLSLMDLVLVAGYPGRTERLLTGREFEESVKTDIVESIADNRRFKALYEDLAARDADLAIKTESARFGLANVIKNRAQALDAIHGMDIVGLRLAADRKLQEWIEASPDRRAQYGSAAADLFSLYKKFEDSETDKRTLDLWRVPIFSRAMTIVRKNEQSAKDDAERDQAYQKRNWDVIANGDRQAQGSLDRRIDQAFLTAVLTRMLERPREEQSVALDVIFGADRTAVSPEQITVKVDELLGQTALYALETRQALLKDAETGRVATSSDPVLALAAAMLPFTIEKITKSRAQAGEYMSLAYIYVRAKRAFLESEGRKLAPDANSTLRVTFGQVMDQVKTSDGQRYPAFTTLEEAVAAHVPGKKDFEVPANVRDAARTGVSEPFANADGEVPVDFQANVDTTGGNSGSAALNGRGELVGLLFDGNEETLYSDWHFDGNVRSILVDVRYFLWTLFNVEKATHLLREMDLTPDCAELLRE